MLIAVSLISHSCYEDKGNYDYTSSKQVTVEPFEKSYSRVTFKQTLDIKPDIKNEIAGDSYEYLWTAYLKVKPDMENDKGFRVDTISTERNLNYAVALKPGKYTLSFRLTNKSKKELGLVTTTELNVSTEFSEGVYILKEIGGNTEIDFVNNSGEVSSDLLNRFIGGSLKGKPVSLSYLASMSYLDKESSLYVEGRFVFPVSEDDMAMISTDDISKLRGYEEMFYSVPFQKEQPYCYYPGVYYGVGYNSSKGIYADPQWAIWGMMSSGTFAPKGKYVDDLNYELHFNTIFGAQGTMAFDVKNGRFIHVDGGSVVMLYDDSNSSVKYTGIKDKLLFMGSSVVGDSYGYAIFENSTTSERSLYLMNPLDLSSGEAPSTTIQKIPSTLKFATATHFATCRKGGTIIYFVSENKLYAYNVMSKTEELLSLSGISSYDSITYFDTMYSEIGDSEKHYNYFIIGTVTGNAYTVSIYDMVGGIPSGAPKRSFSGTGKVHTLQLVDPIKREAPNFGDGTARAAMSISY